MTPFTKLTYVDISPNLGKAFKKLVLVEKIRDTANINTVLGFSILKAINSNQKSDKEILKTVREYALHNPEATSIVLSEELTQEILNLEL